MVRSRLMPSADELRLTHAILQMLMYPSLIDFEDLYTESPSCLGPSGHKLPFALSSK